MSGIAKVGGSNPITPPIDLGGVAPTTPLASTPPAVSNSPTPSAPTPLTGEHSTNRTPLDRPKIQIPSDLSNFSAADLSRMIRSEVQKTSDELSKIKKVQIEQNSAAEQAANKAEWQKLIFLADPELAQRAQRAMEGVMREYYFSGAGAALRYAEMLAPDLAPLAAFMSLTEFNADSEPDQSATGINLDGQNHPVAGFTPNKMIAMQIVSALFVAVSTLGLNAVKDIVDNDDGVLGDMALLSLGAASAKTMNDAAIKHVQTAAQNRSGPVSWEDLDLGRTLENGWKEITTFNQSSKELKMAVTDAMHGTENPLTHIYTYSPEGKKFFDDLSSNDMLKALLHSASSNANDIHNLLETEYSTSNHLANLPNNA